MATRRTTQDGRRLGIAFVDVNTAYFHDVPRRNLHLFLPTELGLGKNATEHLLKCVYGTRDAGQIWEDVCAHALVKMGFRRGVADPCYFFPTGETHRRGGARG